MNRQRGFTLLEVLIALAVVALAVGALLGTVTSSASNVIYLREKTLAEWVALNRLTEIRIATTLPSKGRRMGNAVMGGRKFEWEEEVTELPVQGLLRVEVRAHATGETIDDTRPVDAPTQQKETPSSPSTSATDKVAWTSTVTGVLSSSRADLRTPIGAPLTGNLNQSGQPPGQQPPPGPKTGAPSS